MMFLLIHSSFRSCCIFHSPLRTSDCTIHTWKYKRIKHPPSPNKQTDRIINRQQIKSCYYFKIQFRTDEGLETSQRDQSVCITLPPPWCSKNPAPALCHEPLPSPVITMINTSVRKIYDDNETHDSDAWGEGMDRGTVAVEWRRDMFVGPCFLRLHISTPPSTHTWHDNLYAYALCNN